MTEENVDLLDYKGCILLPVSKDFSDKAEIITKSKKKFGKVDELLKQNIDVGNFALLKDGNRYIFYLVVKKKPIESIKLCHLRKGLKKLYEFCKEDKINSLAISRKREVWTLSDRNWIIFLRHLRQIFVDVTINIY